jgi:hypothetical protein
MLERSRRQHPNKRSVHAQIGELIFISLEGPAAHIGKELRKKNPKS